MAARSTARARRATSGGSHSPSDAVEWQCRSMCGVMDLGGGPRRLRLAEQLQQLAVGELQEGTVRRAGAERREVRHPTATLRAGPVLEDQAELIAAVDGHPARGVNLPALAVYLDGASGHGLCLRRGGDGNLTPQLPRVGRVGRQRLEALLQLDLFR